MNASLAAIGNGPTGRGRGSRSRHLRSSPLLASAMFLLLGLIAPGVAQAAPASAPADQTGVETMAGQSVHFANGKSVVIPKNWTDMTVADLAQIGIKPNTDYTGKTPKAVTGRTTATASQPSTGVHILNASGTNKQVSISLESRGGKGPIITFWGTTAIDYTGTYICTYAVYYSNGSIVETGGEVCGQAPAGYPSQFVGTNLDLPKNYGGKQLCNTWVHFTGRPCKDVS